ncbi:hypothetical protein SAMN04488028_101207 [Reichenbachiella agariperforans]|uniref:Uncharacterized protein n=2 Tax=Reichenbachiella agariperforans TaxID=156994 RepID=A0A1M6JII0_REIAG|nr:hypothetical protein SAMN04488028_101207 [Reichenbachiella agariperforans]
MNLGIAKGPSRILTSFVLPMRNPIGILLTFIFITQALVPNMDICCELEKLPALISHYQEHKAYDGDSFVAFLIEDYLSDEEEGHHDEAQDNDLPFHGQHQCQHAPLFCTIEQQFSISELSAIERTQYTSYDQNIASEYSEAPFQPPKLG